MLFPKTDRSGTTSNHGRVYKTGGSEAALNIIMPGATAIVLYPRKEGSTFDKEYYLKTHMPLAMKHWGPHGLKSYAVSELSADGPYSISSVMEFDSQEAVGKAMQDPGTKEIMDDVKNFTNSEPILVHGNIIGTS
ncbi:hypothetical protein J4E82_005122 [Alternaria postmessia]|nr:uncharacterized protein J4E82_005122 [Alternaria postmessia]KAI5376127.1 hypothetical protein J4E82_005122 [Alternaria postmessia]